MGDRGGREAQEEEIMNQALDYNALVPLVPRGGMHARGSCLLFRECAVPLLHFSRLPERNRRDGAMRGLEALESDSFTLWGWTEAKERMVPQRMRQITWENDFLWALGYLGK